MDELPLRLAVLTRLLVPFLFMMASAYVALHMLFARLVVSPQSPVLWFFAVVTGPLTRPFRALLPAGTPEGRIRAVALVAYLVLWLATDKLGKAWMPLPGP